MLSRWLGAADAIRSIETAQLHRTAGRRGSHMAVRGTVAAVGTSGDRAFKRSLGRRVSLPNRRLSEGAKRDRVYRGPERSYRISLGGWKSGSGASACSRLGGTPNGRDFHGWW